MGFLDELKRLARPYEDEEEEEEAESLSDDNELARKVRRGPKS